jgi:putative transposase
MSHFRRAHVPGGYFFFTVVTEQRAPILCTDTSRVFLRTAIRECRQRWTFRIDALVLLDNHLHAILTLPEGDTRYSARWAKLYGRVCKTRPDQVSNHQYFTACWY